MFCHFLKFGPLVLLGIAYDGSLEHCLTTNRGKTHRKKIRGPQIEYEIRVFAIFARLHH